MSMAVTARPPYVVGMNTRPTTLLAAVVSIALTGVGAILFGALFLAVAAGLWLGRTWAWPVAAGTQLMATIAAVVVIATSGPQVPALIATALVVVGLVTVLAPPSRRALRV
ncbi:hypothetical protein BH20CHL7_BH20CHL7_14570 [soil metagenome]